MNKLSNHLILLSSILALSSCGGTPTSTSTSGGQVKEIIDLQNRTVTIDKTKVDRVICLGAGALRMYSYIGDLSKLVGVEEIDRTTFGVGTALRPYYLVNQDTFKAVPSCGTGGPMDQAPNYEKLIECNPNIIISLYSSKDVNDEISQRLNIPVVALSSGNNGVYDEATKKSFTLLGDIFSKEARAKELNDYISETEAEFAKLSMSEDNAYVGCIGNWGRTNLYGTYYNFPVLSVAKVKNVVNDLSWPSGAKQVTIDAEKLAEIDPDRIFLDDAGFSGFISDYKVNKSKYDALKAFQNKEIYGLFPYNAYYINLEIQIMSTYYVSSIYHEDAFPSFDIAKKANEVSKKFLGVENYSDMCKALTSLDGYGKINLEAYLD